MERRSAENLSTVAHCALYIVSCWDFMVLCSIIRPRRNSESGQPIVIKHSVSCLSSALLQKSADRIMHAVWDDRSDGSRDEAGSWVWGLTVHLDDDCYFDRRLAVTSEWAWQGAWRHGSRDQARMSTVWGMFTSPTDVIVSCVFWCISMVSSWNVTKTACIVAPRSTNVSTSM